jgi:MSHA biogenesis protein MshL
MRLTKNKQLITLLSLTGLVSCQSLAPTETPKNQMLVNSINASQESNLTAITSEQALSTLSFADTPTQLVSEERFDVSVKNVAIDSFLLGLVDATDYNLIISPDLNIKVTLQLKDVTISEVLQAVTQIYPIMVKQKDNLFLVSSAETMTAIYPVDYLNIQRKGTSQTRIAGQSFSADSNNNNSGQSNQSNQSNQSRSSGGGGQNVAQIESSNVETKSETDFWKELKTSLNLIVKGQEKANIVVSPHAGIVVVRALPQSQELIKNYLLGAQKSLNRQVIIEAKIIEVSLNEGFQAGVDWSKISNSSNGDVFTIGQQGQVLQQESKDFSLNGIFSLLYQGDSFASAISLLESQGDVQVLSSPRVSTINNQKAIIKVGSDEFFVTDISTTTVTGTSTSSTPSVTLTPFFSGISLDVTPQVNTNGDIVLHIHPIVSEVTDQTKTLNLGDNQFTLPLALSNVRESDSIVRTRSGRVIVIGGLMQNKVTEEVSSTPLLGDIPMLGNLFKQTREFQVKSELVILLRAQVVDLEQNIDQLNQVKDRFSNF